jgi:hypothetical protein
MPAETKNVCSSGGLEDIGIQSKRRECPRTYIDCGRAEEQTKAGATWHKWLTPDLVIS